MRSRRTVPICREPEIISALPHRQPWRGTHGDAAISTLAPAYLPRKMPSPPVGPAKNPSWRRLFLSFFLAPLFVLAGSTRRCRHPVWNAMHYLRKGGAGSTECSDSFSLELRKKMALVDPGPKKTIVNIGCNLGMRLVEELQFWNEDSRLLSREYGVAMKEVLDESLRAGWRAGEAAEVLSARGNGLSGNESAMAAADPGSDDYLPRKLLDRTLYGLQHNAQNRNSTQGWAARYLMRHRVGACNQNWRVVMGTTSPLRSAEQERRGLVVPMVERRRSAENPPTGGVEDVLLNSQLLVRKAKILDARIERVFHLNLLEEDRLMEKFLQRNMSEARAAGGRNRSSSEINAVRPVGLCVEPIASNYELVVKAVERMKTRSENIGVDITVLPIAVGGEHRKYESHFSGDAEFRTFMRAAVFTREKMEKAREGVRAVLAAQAGGAASSTEDRMVALSTEGEMWPFFHRDMGDEAASLVEEVARYKTMSELIRIRRDEERGGVEKRTEKAESTRNAELAKLLHSLDADFTVRKAKSENDF